MSRQQKGFSLIELLIVVSIILILAAIAIPNLLRSRSAANEASAVGSISTINTAQVAYASNYPECGFAENLTALGGTASSPASTAAGLIDASLARGSKSGYTFAAPGGPGGCGAGNNPRETYTVTAQPQSAQTGGRYFFSDESGIIRYNHNAVADVNSTPLQ